MALAERAANIWLSARSDAIAWASLASAMKAAGAVAIPWNACGVAAAMAKAFTSLEKLAKAAGLAAIASNAAG